MEKYTCQVSVGEILEMYNNDPESFFMDKTRTVSKFFSVEVCRLHYSQSFRNMSQ
jgi:hypothetical protein